MPALKVTTQTHSLKVPVYLRFVCGTCRQEVSLALQTVVDSHGHVTETTRPCACGGVLTCSVTVW